MSNAARFYNALLVVNAQETNKRLATELLDEYYPILVDSCPHIEAIDHKMSIRGWGTWRVCTTCGLEDHALIGATSGDEYDYGFAGSIDYGFWSGTEARPARDEKEFYSYRRGHGFQVRKGKVSK